MRRKTLDPWGPGKIGTPRRFEEHEIDAMIEWLEWASAMAGPDTTRTAPGEKHPVTVPATCPSVGPFASPSA